jgi:MATE family multidrug resistance protein
LSAQGRSTIPEGRRGSGQGLASLAANGIAALAALIWLARKGLLGGKAPPSLGRRLARVAAPLAIGHTGEGAAYALVGVMLGGFGAAVLAANQIVQALGGVLYMLPLGVSAAAAIRVGQAIGAGGRARLRPIAKAAIGSVTLRMALVTLGLVWFGPAISAALSEDAEVTALGALRGAADFIWPKAFTLACHWLFALPLAFAPDVPADLGPLALWALWPRRRACGNRLAAQVLAPDPLIAGCPPPGNRAGRYPADGCLIGIPFGTILF